MGTPVVYVSLFLGIFCSGDSPCRVLMESQETQEGRGGDRTHISRVHPFMAGQRHWQHLSLRPLCPQAADGSENSGAPRPP